MTSKGFTLVELLAVIAIIGILSVVALGTYNGVTNKSKKKAYENKISQIETSAAKWAQENNIDRTTAISVNKLVVEGYLTADEAKENGLSIIKNPVNDENIICKMVEIKYKNGEVITSFVENSNNCSLAEQALDDTRITVQAYEKDIKTKPTLNTNNSFSWTNQPLTLVVSSDDYDDKMVSISYDYEGNTIEKNKSGLIAYTGKSYINDEEADKYYNVFNIDAEVIYDGNIIITYKLNDGSTKSRTVNVRIDKEEATASVLAKSDWVAESQKVTVKIDDGNGSGARRFYIGPGNSYNDSTVKKIELCDSNGKNCKYEKDYNAPSVGEYNIWTEDMVGNISAAPKNKLSVNNVDSTEPSCEFEFEGTMGENNWYVTKVTPKMHTSTAGISGLYYGIAKDSKKDYSNYVGYNEIGRDQETIQDDTTGQPYTCAAKSLAGKGTHKSATIKVDTIAPTIKITPDKQESYVKSVSITIEAHDGTSGLAKNSKIEYAWSTNGASAPTTWNSINIPGTNFTGDRGPTDTKKVTINASGMTGVYYLWIKNGTIKDVAGNKSLGLNGGDRRYGPFHFDNTPPECSLTSSGTYGLSYWYISNAVVSFSSHTDNDSGVASYGIGDYLGAKSENLTTDTKSITYKGYIKDKVGNTNTCSITIKRDVTKPTINNFQLSSQGNGYGTQVANVTLNATDATSGNYQMCIQKSNNVSACSWKTYSQNSTVDTSIGNNTGGSVTYYAWVKDNAGNISNMSTSNNYKIYKNCTEQVNNGNYTCGGYGACPDVCGGTQYATKTQPRKDKYTGVTCNSVVTTNGCSKTCGGTNNYYTYSAWSGWGACTDACGGTQTRSRTGYKYSTDGTKICSSADTQTEQQNCGGTNTYYTYGTWSKWSTCSDKCGGTQSRSRSAIKYSTDGTKACVSTTDSESQKCGGKEADYSGASCVANSGAKCSKSCGGGTKAGTKTGKYVSTIDGKKCSSSWGKPSKSCNASCNTQACCTNKSMTTDTYFCINVSPCGTSGNGSAYHAIVKENGTVCAISRTNTTCRCDYPNQSGYMYRAKYNGTTGYICGACFK